VGSLAGLVPRNAFVESVEFSPVQALTVRALRSLTDCLGLDFQFRHHPMLCGMANTPKVVPLDQNKSRVIALDESTNRIIIAIGRQRVALDMSTRITELAPDVGDKPAKILPLITPWKPRKRKS
jgi:hypothetical protein